VGRSTVLLPPGDERPERTNELALTRTVHVRKDLRPFRVSVTIPAIRDDDGKLLGSSLIARDVTALVELEQELREAQRREAVGRRGCERARSRGAAPARARRRRSDPQRRAGDAGDRPDGDRLGLGLAQVFALDDSSGGTIGVESALVAGTTVRVYLPRAAEAVA
jgi:hypothetical protein